MREVNTNGLQLKMEENFSLIRKEKQTKPVLVRAQAYEMSKHMEPKLANRKPGEARCCRDGNDLFLQSEEDTGRLESTPGTPVRFGYSTLFACFSILKIECYLFILVKKIIQNKTKIVITSNFESYKSFLQRDTIKRS